MSYADRKFMARMAGQANDLAKTLVERNAKIQRLEARVAALEEALRLIDDAYQDGEGLAIVTALEEAGSLLASGSGEQQHG